MITAWPETVNLLISSEGVLPKLFVNMSLQKYSSNVVDRLIQNATLPQVLMIMRELEQSDQLDKVMVS